MDQTALQAVFAVLPEPWRTYAASALGIAGVVSLLSSTFAAAVKPPSSTAPSWVRTAYAVATWPAINLGWSRNAVVPGMPPAVQQAAIISAKLAAAVPETTVVQSFPEVRHGNIMPTPPSLAIPPTPFNT